MQRSSTRASTWLLPVGLSLALHLALLLGLGTLALSLKPLAPQTAAAPSSRHLIRVDVLGHRAGAVEVPVAGPKAPASIAAPTPVAHGPSTLQALAATAPQPTQAGAPASATLATESATGPGAGDRDAVTTGTEGGETGPAAPTLGPVEKGPSGPDLSQLMHQRLASAAERCYPAAARRFRQVGVVTVGFCVTDSGGVNEVRLRRSSGAMLLDDAATACVVPGAVPLPREATGRCFEVPVHFGR